MRKIFTLLLVLAGMYVSAQQYNNEWISFQQTYYKIKVIRAGVYRVPKSVLDAVGIGNADVRNFEIWRNGEKVPFYPTVPSGVLPANGYLEFYGEKNDGKADKALYRNPAWQHTDKMSLQTDTAVYFLSVNNNQSGYRITDVTNNVAGNALPVEPWFMYTKDSLFMRGGRLPHPGFAGIVGTYVYSSSYDQGEFFSSGDIYPNAPFYSGLGPLYVNGSGPNSTLKFGAAGSALNPRTVKVKVNDTEVKDTVMDYFNDLLTTVTVPTSLIASGTANLEFSNTSAIPNDRMVISHCELTYPRAFNFNNQANFRFTLPARSSGYFLQIENFSNGGTPPVLYDLINHERFTGDLSVAGKIQFALPGTANDRQLVLVSEDASNITTVSALIPRVFTDYTAAANQGDYLIISNPVLYTGSSGNNPVTDYKNYRQSTAGGGFKVVQADINELVDQFAFGIKMHPLSIRNFIRFARARFASQPKFVFLIGRGMNYAEYQRGLRQPGVYPFTEQLNLVPTFGYPASDNLLSAEDLTVPVATTPIGRLSVINGKEIEIYLEKVREYELVQKTAPQTLEAREWMKNVVHVTGSSDFYLGTILCNYMNGYKQVIEDTSFGGKVATFCKESTNPVEQLSSERLSNLFAEGISFLTYFGHSSNSTLEFNIDNPDAYNNQGKYPVFFVNGCSAGDFFNYSAQRMVANETLSEKFVLAKQRGSIGFVASTHYGIVNYLNLFLESLYTMLGKDFTGSLGETKRAAMQHMMANLRDPNDFYARMHAEEMTLNGDPAIHINGQKKPDYVLEQSSIRINPAFISLAESSFELKVKVVNLGLAVADSITLEIKQQYPNGSIGVLYRQKIPGIRDADSVILDVPIIASRDKGPNKIIITADADNVVDEITESNNSISKEFFIFEEEARPIYPYNFAIINNPAQKLFVSTANPLTALKGYIMELDTTEAFTSPVKVSKTITSVGGVLEFDPGITYKDSTTYYWRVSIIPTDNNEYHWIYSSFTYVNANEEGFGQFKYYQHLKSATKDIELTNDLKWTFGTTKHEVFFSNAVYPTGSGQEATYYVSLDNMLTLGAGCSYNELIINVVHPVTFKPWINQFSGSGGLYGSNPACGAGGRIYNFGFGHDNAARRKLAMDFLDLIPEGYYVLIRNNCSPGYAPYPNNVFPEAWKADTAMYGSGNSLYHRLFHAGLYELDSFSVARSMNFIYKKGDSTFSPRYNFSKDIFTRSTLQVNCLTTDTVGVITSPVFGPAKQWHRVVWTGESIETSSPDNPTVDIVGIDKNSSPTVLYTLDKNTQTLDVSSVDAAQYPYMQLRMRNIDSINLTPYQLKYWKIHHDPVPEGAIAPNLWLKMRDTLEVGDSLQFEVAFKNVSKPSFDSIAVKATILDKNNVTHTLVLPKTKPIVTGDTVIAVFKVGTVEYTGINTLFIDFNFDNDQPEYQHFNNFLYHEFYVIPDKTNPLLDVTFDGVHILNKDIVSAKPHIQIKLKDEAKYMLLNDTSISSVEILFPDNTTRTYHFDGDTLRFIPATSGSDNTATIEFTPAFLDPQKNPEGDEYQLIVKGKDKSGNSAGNLEYRVAFTIIAKPMISNLLNYPNPFSTSTAFVFTITGAELPQNLRIQILTVTGKIVREITMNELGNVHIGRNITDFKWDGSDQYGQKLANGVYLYRVITSMNGMPMEKYKARSDDTDKYFNNGYGKMYLMR